MTCAFELHRWQGFGWIADDLFCRGYRAGFISLVWSRFAMTDLSSRLRDALARTRRKAGLE